MRLCYKLGMSAVALLLPWISAHPASTRTKIDPDPVIRLRRTGAPRCAVVCGISCIRPWAPFNETAFPMLYDGGLFECLRSEPVPSYPWGAPRNPVLQAIRDRALSLTALPKEPVGNDVTPREAERASRHPLPVGAPGNSRSCSARPAKRAFCTRR